MSIIIPVYNESEIIIESLNRIKQNIRLDHEILVIYDNDDDSTIPYIKDAQHKDKNILLIKNNIFPSPSGAIRTGFKEAKAPVILVTMADLSDEIIGLNELVNKIPGEFDIISFSRFCIGGNVILNKPDKILSLKRFKHFLKILFPKIAGKLINFLTRIGTNDPTNSYKLYSAAMIKSLNLKSKVSFSITLEIVMKSYSLGYKIKELPTTWRDRTFGESNFPLIKSLVSYLPWLLIFLYKNRLYSFGNKRLIENFSIIDE